MRNALIAAMLATIMLVWPVAAQPSETVMLNATVRVLPGIRGAECYWFEAGTVTISARQVGDNQWPVDFSMVPDTGPVSGMLVFRINSMEMQSVSQRVDAGWRCYSLRHLGSPNMISPNLWPRWEQAVEMRITSTP